MHRCLRRVGIPAMALLCLFLQWISYQHFATLPSTTMDYDQRLGVMGEACMPRPRFDTIAADPMAFTCYSHETTLKTIVYNMSVAFDLSGCESKFEITSYNQSFIFKPARRVKDALNELLAYHVDQIFEFYRVPPVMPVQVPIARISDLLSPNNLHHHHNRLHCNMELTQDDRQKWIRVNVPVPDQTFMSTKLANLTSIKHVIGSLQLKVPGVTQRSELVRFVDRTLATALSNPFATTTNATTRDDSFLHQAFLPSAPSVFAQRERGTRALFDYLIGNVDRFNNDHIITTQPSPSYANNRPPRRMLVYIDNNSLANPKAANLQDYLAPFDLHEWTSGCRFYRQPVERLSNITNPSAVLLHTLKVAHGGLARRWIDTHRVLSYRRLYLFQYLNQRIVQVLQRVDECVKTKGYHHVFVER